MKVFMCTFTRLIFILDAQCDPWETLVEDEETVDSLKIRFGRDHILRDVPAEVDETVHSIYIYIYI